MPLKPVRTLSPAPVVSLLVPMRLPWITLPFEVGAPPTLIPGPVFPEMTFWSKVPVPPIVLFELPEIAMPRPFAFAAVPSAVVPMKQPATLLPPAPCRLMAVPRQSLIASARTVEPPAVTVKAVSVAFNAAPSSTISGVPAYVPCVEPSIKTGWVTVGSGDPSAIVFGPAHPPRR